MTHTPALFIDGRPAAATSGETFTTLHPGTGEVLATVQLASAADVDRAVAAARRAFPAWSTLSGTERAGILSRAAQLLRDHLEELARLEALDTGKPITEARTVDVPSAADVLAYFAGVAPTLHGTHHQLPGGSFAFTRREPLGVCAGIGAWNYPLQIACWKAAPALACGNTMVFKPSELTPLSALRLAEIFAEAGLPPGVFNVVQGAASIGTALAAHPGIAKLSLTGSVETGKRAMATAASTLKHVTMELGGKSPLLIFDDADLEQAVRGALLANFFTQGEVCSNGTRVFVHESIRTAFLERLVPRVAALRLGDPLDASTQVGALISAAHRDKIRAYVESGVASGAKLLVGGTVPTRPGFFLTPAVFDACTDDMRIVQEEIFGPVLCVLPFHSEEEAIARANATPFGLAAGVFTRDLQRGHRVAAALDAGVCWINNYNITPVELPFGGNKHSGLGRENGLAAVEHYTQLKTVYVEMGTIPAPF
jgi:betaine-aldehyde dehydrogenase